jgi:rhodanese-related sulfurtransferase
MRSLFQKFNIILNVVIAICAVVFLVVLIKAYVVLHSQAQEVPVLAIGGKFDLKGFNWGDNRRTVILALSKQCHYCSESAPFYQQLSEEVKAHSGVRLLAIFSESVPDAKSYLEQINVSVDDVRQAPLSALGVKGTPMLLVIDESGFIKDLWFGKLTDFQAKRFIRKFHDESDVASALKREEEEGKRIDLEEVHRLVKTGEKVTILDVRRREIYAAGHAAGSINIPSDELDVRAVNELSPTDFIITSCQCADARSSTLARDRLMESGFKKVAVLREP